MHLEDGYTTLEPSVDMVSSTTREHIDLSQRQLIAHKFAFICRPTFS